MLAKGNLNMQTLCPTGFPGECKKRKAKDDFSSVAHAYKMEPHAECLPKPFSSHLP